MRINNYTVRLCKSNTYRKMQCSNNSQVKRRRRWTFSAPNHTFSRYVSIINIFIHIQQERMNQQSIYNSTVFKIENVGPYYDTDFFSKSLIFHL